jgi:hypothetical protein
VRWSYLNPQGQPKIEWPPSFPLAKAYVDQLERSRCLPAARIGEVRASIARAEGMSGAARTGALTELATSLDRDARTSCDAPKVRTLQGALRSLTGSTVP